MGYNCILGITIDRYSRSESQELRRDLVRYLGGLEKLSGFVIANDSNGHLGIWTQDEESASELQNNIESTFKEYIDKSEINIEYDIMNMARI